MFRTRFWWSLLLSVPVVLTSHMVSGWLGYQVPSALTWVPPVLGTVVYLYGGWPFLSGVVGELRERRPGMMTLVAMAITVAFGSSVLATFGVVGMELDFWWELVLLVVVMLLGHWLEMRALGQASGALEALAALLPDRAERVGADGGVEEVGLADLRTGDTVLVRSGGRVPADGTVVEGGAAMDESMITGESRAVTRSEGDRVVAGTVATDSAVRVRVDAVGEDTALAGIQRLVSEAQESRSRSQALADRAAALLFWFALVAAVLTAAVWTLFGEVTEAVERTVTVLVIACPHALGLAIPLVIAISTAVSARNGILVKDRMALERTRLVDTVLFDKTGTLTKGAPAVTDTSAASGHASERVLALAGAVEADSEHPLARAIVRAARETGAVPAATGFRSLTGRGVRASVEGSDVQVGGPALLESLGLTEPDDLAGRTGPWRERGATVLHVVVDGGVAGALALADEVRPESAEAVRRLQERGVRVAMVTGDARNVADAVAERLGLDEVFAQVLPDQKDAVVRDLQSRGNRVAMVGDGVNDAPALARADVGIAIGAGTDVAIESAGVVLASDDPRGVVAVRGLSAAGYRKMVQNLVWAAGYNVVAVPLAAGVLAPVGIVLAPAVGAVLMSLSTIIVALNAQLLRRVDLSTSS
ncbi:heavy metal translocating P-type ATPase [Nocardiopsis dassonvillei]|uniref:Copper-translocating P-type ATPase n=1 Tax=Nocardiopsis dassonvillei (strain ATCC 23218 / DSM 43111 / CIP 107115 / JCM 7437 / KCTC 9190 / NBRC 14626 / NCTC 10488 / NRRL B-5397 / IMRU 509) TaxID=446468 RepID=D7B096_NOCDD|nr:heavy metal translocating P-type ATPase [Nocardiopsis dassonvillei]ADH70184.1 copper-translocating P-type ATPase [Nocardiopsis dassonvillei subsp. dassonvillei DSM 43111]NKY80259.1 heavy metal translocating P-type ATPase [Nocardiopsis dassonvillei]VEI90701.1 Copper-exporting P-type ATPase B [Nocardiopsis dassonvillei]